MAPTARRDPILVVEDSPQDVALLRRAFEKAEVLSPLLSVSSGDEAIAFLSGDPALTDRSKGQEYPQLVLLDLKLPGKTGHEVLEWIRTTPGITRLPVIVLTTSNEESDVARAYELGANSYLVKPATFQELRHMVEAVWRYWMILNTPPPNIEPDYVGGAR
jgi:CheY-like chemotaxis protein